MTPIRRGTAARLGLRAADRHRHAWVSVRTLDDEHDPQICHCGARRVIAVEEAPGHPARFILAEDSSGNPRRLPLLL